MSSYEFQTTGLGKMIYSETEKYFVYEHNSNYITVGEGTNMATKKLNVNHTIENLTFPYEASPLVLFDEISWE